MLPTTSAVDENPDIQGVPLAFDPREQAPGG